MSEDVRSGTQTLTPVLSGSPGCPGVLVLRVRRLISTTTTSVQERPAGRAPHTLLRPHSQLLAANPSEGAVLSRAGCVAGRGHRVPARSGSSAAAVPPEPDGAALTDSQAGPGKAAPGRRPGIQRQTNAGRRQLQRLANPKGLFLLTINQVKSYEAVRSPPLPS